MLKYTLIIAATLLSGPAFAAGSNGCENGNPPNCDDGGGTAPPSWNVGGGAGGNGGNGGAGGDATSTATATSGGNTLTNSASGNDTSVSVQGDQYREAAQAVSVVVATACGAGFGGSDRNMTVNFAKGQSSFCKNLVLYEMLKDSDPKRAAAALDRAYDVAALDAAFVQVRSVLTLGLLGE